MKLPSRAGRRFIVLLLAGVGAAGLLYVLGSRAAGMPPLGTLLDPVDGLYRTARRAVPPGETVQVDIPSLEVPVTVVRDARGVPHIFAASDRDAVTALGYVVAQDRLFQLDFISRVAAGRLAAALGPQAVEADRFLRQTGMAWGARKNLRRIRRAQGIEWKVINWYADGVNAYLDGLEASELPLAFRLLGYQPDRYEPIDALFLLQYMTFDLTWGTDSPVYALLRRDLGAAAYEQLYPRFPRLYVPIIPPSASERGEEEGKARSPLPPSPVRHSAMAVWRDVEAFREMLRGTLAEGYIPGKGSNNWAVTGARSATGASILAGDMHLALTLPAIWYEAHLVTPTMNLYGVTIPGAPLLVEGFNDHVGWAYTNTGTDQIDHLALTLDASGTRYRYKGEWRDLKVRVDTIRVNGAPPVTDTLYFSHWGPVFRGEWPELGAVAVQWTAHDTSRTLQALWEMSHARSAAAFKEALRLWDTPMQNVLYATRDTIAIRSAGYLPIRRGENGAGLLDGSTDAAKWIGRVPFENLPHALNPPRGYLTSTNQPPTDSTYAYYLGHHWLNGWRSLRIETLLSSKPQHTVADLKRYQADVHAVQSDYFVPLLDTLSLPADQDRADVLRRMLVGWDGWTSTDRPEPLILDVFLEILRTLAWDEPPFPDDVPHPDDGPLLDLLKEQPRSKRSSPPKAGKWLDIVGSPEREGAADLLRRALTATADTLASRYGWGAENWRWGAHHKVAFRHLTGAEALRALWRGPFEFPGFASTLSPARDLLTTHSASWRMVVDFSQLPPQGWGVYPGGQHGNPFSPLYDAHLPTYLAFEYYELLRPDTPEGLEDVRSRTMLVPKAQ